jgi:hypothetical protein
MILPEGADGDKINLDRKMTEARRKSLTDPSSRRAILRSSHKGLGEIPILNAPGQSVIVKLRRRSQISMKPYHGWMERFNGLGAEFLKNCPKVCAKFIARKKLFVVASAAETLLSRRS